MSEENEVVEYITVEELNPNSKRVYLKVKVLSKNDEREVISKKTGETLRVTEALVGDETGTVLMTLWNDDIDRVNAEKVLQVENAYITLFNGYMRLNIGKYGTLKEIESEDFGEVNSEKNMSDQQFQVPRFNRPRFQRNFNNSNRSSFRRPPQRR